MADSPFKEELFAFYKECYSDEMDRKDEIRKQLGLAVAVLALLGALLHEFYRVYPCRMLFFGQLLFSTLYDWGLPRWIMRLRMAQPKRLSTCWLASVRAFSLSPMRCL